MHLRHSIPTFSIRDLENVVKLAWGRGKKDNRANAFLIFMENLQVAQKCWPEIMVRP